MSVLQDGAGRIVGLLDADGWVAVFSNMAFDAAGNAVGATLPNDSVTGAVVAVASSRALTAADNGQTLDCTAAGITLTIPSGVLLTLGVVIIANGTTSVASSGGTLLNGATSTIARDATLTGAARLPVVAVRDAANEELARLAPLVTAASATMIGARADRDAATAALVAANAQVVALRAARDALLPG